MPFSAIQQQSTVVASSPPSASQLTFGSPSRSLVAPPLPPPPRPPTPPRPYLSTSPETISPFQSTIDKGNATEPRPIVELRRASPPRPTLQVRTSPAIPIPVSPPRRHPPSPVREHDIMHRFHRPSPTPTDRMSIRSEATLATMATSGSRYEGEDEFELAVGAIDLGDGAEGAPPVTWGGARVREPEEMARPAPAQEVGRRDYGSYEQQLGAGRGVGRLFGRTSGGAVVAGPSSSSTPPSSPPQPSHSHSLRNPFARRSHSQSTSQPLSSSPRDHPAISPPTHPRPLDSHPLHPR